MKFTCEKYVLENLVSTAGRASALKSPNPLLNGVLLTGEVTLTATGYDLKKAITATSDEVDVLETGNIVVDAKLLNDIVHRLPDGIVHFDAKENLSINITCGNAEYNIVGMEGVDYPDLPETESKTCLTIKQGTLATMIHATAFAISDNDSRPVYTGALFTYDGDRITMVTVDGYRLAVRKEAIERCDLDTARFIVPGEALLEVEKLCTGDDTVSITYDKKHVCFNVKDKQLITRKLEGDFLNYRKSVPETFPYTLTFNTADLLKAVDRVSLMINEKNKTPVRCTFEDGRMNMFARTPAGQAEDKCYFTGEYGDLMIGFNHLYLIQALKSIEDETFTMNLSGSTAPCILLPADGSDKFLYMILPVRLKNGE